jgi:hypothetical protein
MHNYPIIINYVMNPKCIFNNIMIEKCITLMQLDIVLRYHIGVAILFLLQQYQNMNLISTFI